MSHSGKIASNKKKERSREPKESAPSPTPILLHGEEGARAETGLGRTACACGGDCPRCRNAGPSLPPSLTRSGESLCTTLRQRLSPMFDFDLSRVRIHRGSAAQRSADAIDAQAYALGPHIVWGSAALPFPSPEGKPSFATSSPTSHKSVPGRSSRVRHLRPSPPRTTSRGQRECGSEWPCGPSILSRNARKDLPSTHGKLAPTDRLLGPNARILRHL